MAPGLIVPTVSPQGQGTPYQSDAGASAEAFGAGVGRLGATFEHLGDVLQKHAVNFQQLNNEAMVNEATTNYLLKQGEMQSAYHEKQGADAFDGPNGNHYTDHVKSLTEMRTDVRSSLPNPYAQKLFDQQTMKQQAYAINNDSSYAATQRKKYMGEASKARTSALQSTAAQQANDDQFRTTIDEIAETTRTDPDNAGDAPEVVDQKVRKAQSEAWKNRLTTLGDPLQARELLNTHRGEIDGVMADQIEKNIDSQIINVGSRTQANKITSGGPTTTLADREQYGMNALASNYGKAGAAAILGNMHAETAGLNPKASTSHDGHDGSAAIGIGQWNAERATALKQFATDRGMDVTDFKTQIAFVNYELQTTHKDLGDKLRATTDPAQAARLVALEYERPKGAETGVAENTSGWSVRLNNTLRLAGKELGPPGLNPDSPAGTLGRMENEGRKAARADAEKLGLSEETATRYEDATVTRIQANYNSVVTAARDTTNANRLTVDEELLRVDNPPTKLEELSPETQQAYYDMNAKEQDRINARLVANATKQPMTKERQDRYDEIIGESVSNPRQFVDTDYTGEDLPQSSLNRINAKQKQLLKDINAPQEVGHALTVLKNNGYFDGKGFDPQKNEKRYHQFTGALQTAMEQATQIKGSKLTDDEIKKLGTGIMQQIYHPDQWFGKHDDKADPSAVGVRAALGNIPQSALDQIIQSYKVAKGRAPSPREIYDTYNNPRNAELFGKKAEADTSGSE